MATMKLYLSREQLAAFLPDHESIKQFERLFSLTAAAPNQEAIDILTINLSATDIKAGEALDAIGELSGSTISGSQDGKDIALASFTDSIFELSGEVDALSLQAVRNDALSELANDMEELKLAPAPQEHASYPLHLAAPVRNTDTVPMVAGQPVYVDGGADGVLNVKLFIADQTINSTYVIGVVAEDIPVGGIGKVSPFGEVHGIDTSAFSDGDHLYCSETTLGGLVNVEPMAQIIRIGWVLKAAVNGSIFCAFTIY